MSETWPEERADIIGSNGNDGSHYGTRERDSDVVGVTHEHDSDTVRVECACGDSHDIFSYGAGFMASNNGVCENCSMTDEEPSLCSGERTSPYYDPINAVFGPKNPAAHYRHTLRAAINDDDIAQGYVEIKADPYRIADLYRMKGGPREQILKKCLRWTDKGQTEDQVIGEIESALKRWKQMREEDRRVPL